MVYQTDRLVDAGAVPKDTVASAVVTIAAGWWIGFTGLVDTSKAQPDH